MNFNISHYDYKNLGNSFFQKYYSNMITSGLVDNLELFDEKCLCNLNNEEYIGAYKSMIKLAQNGLFRFFYKSFSGTCQPTQNGFLLSSSGICQLINFQNTLITETHFSETFIISSQTMKIIHHKLSFL
jgi:hypothetical protein